MFFWYQYLSHCRDNTTCLSLPGRKDIKHRLNESIYAVWQDNVLLLWWRSTTITESNMTIQHDRVLLLLSLLSGLGSTALSLPMDWKLNMYAYGILQTSSLKTVLHVSISGSDFNVHNILYNHTFRQWHVHRYVSQGTILTLLFLNCISLH